MNGLAAGIDKMRRAGLGDAAIEAFRHYYQRLLDRNQGLLVADRWAWIVAAATPMHTAQRRS